ncbi:MAG TPA: restriction endonuclease subunit S [Puia sp.]|uniref:restriction endonuclease subunit S n=1 Tax=Puia sp. TaxID=2045100 RepID=UPI002B9C2723|nr:restriction endonuclease subunit S [Puia sp.]HVU94846.1 restriction endonuclease subunit S [Puia sp.]
MHNGEMYILIKECAEIRTGQTFKNSPQQSPEGDLRVIQPRDLEEGRLIQPVRVVSSGIPALQNHLLKPGEILIANKGTKLGTFLYKGEPARAIATASFFVLSPKPLILPSYLNWYLNQPPARAYFAQRSSGSTIPSITKSVINELAIPILPLAQQRHIDAVLKESIHEQALLQLLAECKRKFCNSYIWEQIIAEAHETKN